MRAGQGKVLIGEMKVKKSAQRGHWETFDFGGKKDLFWGCDPSPFFILESLEGDGEEREKRSRYLLAHSALKG